MNEKKIRFFTEDITYRLQGKEVLRRGIVQLVKEKDYQLGAINIIFCSDMFLKRYNKAYLKNDYFTDVIAFDLSEEKKMISGDIYISLDRVRENAKMYHVLIKNEIARVIIHGILHLMGMEDSTDELKRAMKIEEDKFLSVIMSG